MSCADRLRAKGSTYRWTLAGMPVRSHGSVNVLH